MAPIPPEHPLSIENGRLETVNDYFSQIPADQQSIFDEYTQDLLEQGGPLPETLVLIPVAAHQEADQIQRALGEYARQEGADPFAVILFLNSPETEADNPEVLRTVDNMVSAQLAHPELDIRMIYGSYVQPVIGGIRRDLWDAALNTLWKQDKMSVIGAIGINHDIDLVKISRSYIANVQRYYRLVENPLHSRIVHQPLAFTQTKHAYAASYPNVSRAVFWSDFLLRQRGGCFEAGIVLPFSRYALGGGFRPTDKTHETAHFVQNTANVRHVDTIKGTSLQTSPRRYLARLAQHGYAGVWAKDSFTADDECRTSSDYTDISHGQLIETVHDGLMDALKALITSKIIVRLGTHYANQVYSGTMDNQVLAEIKQRVVRELVGTGKMIDLVLQNVIESPMGATFAQYHVFSEKRLGVSFDAFIDSYKDKGDSDNSDPV